MIGKPLEIKQGKKEAIYFINKILFEEEQTITSLMKIINESNLTYKISKKEVNEYLMSEKNWIVLENRINLKIFNYFSRIEIADLKLCDNLLLFLKKIKVSNIGELLLIKESDILLDPKINKKFIIEIYHKLFKLGLIVNKSFTNKNNSLKINTFNRIILEILLNEALEEEIIEILPYIKTLSRILKIVPEIEVNSANLFYIHCNYDLYVEQIEEYLKNISKESNDIILKNFFVKERTLITLERLNIHRISDIMKISGTCLLFIFQDEIEVFLKFIKTLNLTEQGSLEYSKKIKSSLSEIQNYVLVRRKGLFGYTILTLEEIGKELNLTRERIRQIEAKTIKLILSIIDIESINIILGMKFDKTQKYISLNKLERTSFDEYMTEMLKIILPNIKSVFNYSSLYNIIFYNKLGELEDIIKKEIKDIGNIISDKKHFNDFQKKILEFHYNKKEGYYILKGVNENDIIYDYIKIFFPNGIKLTDNNQVEKLRKIIIEDFPTFKIPTKRALYGIMERKGIVQTNIGTYMHSDLAPNLSKELIDKIKNYIKNSNMTTVFYKEIYCFFEKDLNEDYNINNERFLKGVIDKELSKNFKTTRDYIINPNGTESIYTSISKTAQSFDREFTFDEIVNLFPGISYATISNVLNDEKKNGLLQIEIKKYTYIDRKKYSQTDKSELIKYINQVFADIGEKVLSSYKIYVTLKIKHPEVLKNYPFIKSSFALYSFLEEYITVFYYKRPHISRENIESVTISSLFDEYILEKSFFTKNDIDNFADKIGQGRILNYLLFIEENSENFIQINQDTMVLKEKSGITEKQVDMIKEQIEFVLNNSEEIHTQIFKGYFLLPKIKYNWNKHLLIGIIRTYFSDDFEILTEGNQYTNVNYIIRRKNGNK